MTEQIRNERLRTLKAKAERAGRKFEEGKQHLFQRGGSKLFAEDVHRRRLEELARERNAVLFEVEEECRQIRAGAAGVLERVQNADPAELLTDEELARANARRAFAIDAAETLPEEVLVERLRSVLAGGDRAVVFAYWMGGLRRREAILERRRERAEARAGSPAAAQPVARGTRLDQVLEEMETALGGEEREAELAAARALGEESMDVEGVANSLRYEGRSPAQMYALRNYAVPGPGNEDRGRSIERLASIR